MIFSSINVTTGNLASPQSPVAVISKIDKVLLKSNINEKEVNNLTTGQEVTVIIPNMDNKEFTGRIKSIAPTMDMQIRSFPIEIEIDNSNLEIQPGTFAKASVEVERSEEVVVVPSQSVIIRGNQGKVFLVDENETAQSVIVTTGLSNNLFTEILSGVNPGDKVITRGNDNVIIGDLVRIVEPMEKQVEAAQEEAAKE
jgi:RND family efflux transporter MFP subunit